MAKRGDFADKDNVAMIQETFAVQSAEQSGEMVDGMIVAAANLLMISALLSLKTHMSMKRESDETELIMMTCFVLGLTLPFLDFIMSVGPRSMVGWIGKMAMLPKEDPTSMNVWNNFGDSDWHALYLVYTVTESLFLWTNIMALGLQGVGFLLLSSVAPTRAGMIWQPKLTILCRVMGGLMLLGFACGMLQEVSPMFGIGYFFIGRLLAGRLLVCVFLVLLGIGFGKVDSLGMQQKLFGEPTGPPPASAEGEQPAAAAESPV